MDSRSVTFNGSLSDPIARTKFQKEQDEFRKLFHDLNAEAVRLSTKLERLITTHKKLRIDKMILTGKMRACKDEEEKSKMELELQTISVNIQNARKTIYIAGNTLNSTIDECNAVGRKILW